VDGLLPFPLLRRLPHWLPWVVSGLGSAAAVGWCVWERMTARASPQEVLAALGRLDLERLFELARWGPWPDRQLCGAGGGVFGAVALLANLRGAVAFSAERERQTWDALLLLPLSGKELLEGKWRGILASCWRCLAAASAAPLAVALLAGPETVLCVLVWLV